jgi:hypothetical protein
MPDVSFTELAGLRVVLRRFRPEGAAEFVAYHSRPEMARHQSCDAPSPSGRRRGFVRQMMTKCPHRVRAGARTASAAEFFQIDFSWHHPQAPGGVIVFLLAGRGWRPGRERGYSW